jgi:putative phosphoesterase
MNLAILADIHDNLANLQKVFFYLKIKSADALLIAGDTTNSDTIACLAENFTGPIYIVQGNGCNYPGNELLKYKQFHNLGRAGGIINLQGQKIGLCHEPKLADKLLMQLPDIIFYGHTHKPWEALADNGTRLINPGNVCGTRFGPSFATYQQDTNDLQLILIDQL